MRLNEDLHQKITIALKIYIYRFFLETHSLLLTSLLITVDNVSKGEQFYNQLTLYQTQALLRVLKKRKRKKSQTPKFCEAKSFIDWADLKARELEVCYQ